MLLTQSDINAVPLSRTPRFLRYCSCRSWHSNSVPPLGQHWEGLHYKQSHWISILKEETQNGWIPFYLKLLKIHVNLFYLIWDCRMVVGKNNQHSLSISQDCSRSLVNQVWTGIKLRDGQGGCVATWPGLLRTWIKQATRQNGVFTAAAVGTRAQSSTCILYTRKDPK